MKDKLRELADEMEACWICASIGEGEITLETINSWSGRLSAILDAEGDGGATWWTTKDGAEPITSEQKAYKISLGYPASYSASHYNVPLYTPPNPLKPPFATVTNRRSRHERQAEGVSKNRNAQDCYAR